MKTSIIRNAPVLIVCIAVVIYSLSKGSDKNFDLFLYHLYSGWALDTLRFNKDLAAVDMQSFYPPYLNWIVYKLYDKGYLYNILIGMLQSFVVLPLYYISNIYKLDNLFEKIILAFILIATPLYLSEVGTSFQSSLTAPLVLMSYYYATKLNANKKDIFLSGFLLTVSSFLKYTNAIFFIGWFLICIFKLKRKEEFLNLAYGILVGAIIFLPYHIWLWVNFNNPIFPLYNGLFKSEFYPFASFRDKRFIFESVYDFISWIFTVCDRSSKTLEFAFGNQIYLLFFSISAIALVQKNFLKPIDRLLIFSIFISFLIWAYVLSYSRYFIAGDLLMIAVIVRILNLLNLKEKITRQLLIVLLFFCISPSLFSIPNWKNDAFNQEFSLKGQDLMPAHYYSLGLQLSKFLIKVNPESRITRIGGDWNGLMVAKGLNFDAQLPARILFERRFVDDIGDLKKLLKISSFSECRKYSNHKSLDDGNSAELDFVILSCDSDNNKNTEYAQVELNRNYLDNASLYNIKDFSGEEPWGRWSTSKNSSLQLIGCFNGTYEIGITFSQVNQDTIVKVDGIPFIKAKMTNDNNHYNKYIATVNLDSCMPIIQFAQPSDSLSPYQKGIGLDKRNLAFGIKDLSFKKLEPKK